jgi:methyl coenzyme M reductase subunit C
MILVAVTMLAGTLLAGSPVSEITVRREQPTEVTVFVTGSLIPQRIKLQPVATTTVSPLRYIDRREIDGTGRRTTAGIFVNEPSLRIIGIGR